MLNGKSNSKKIFMSKNNKTTLTESTMKRFKSQDIYSIAKNKIKASPLLKPSNNPKETPEKRSSLNTTNKEDITSSSANTKLNKYLSNKPLQNNTNNVHNNKIINDFSIQELDKEESKINFNLFYLFYFNLFS
jgi:hypothetical protein